MIESELNCDYKFEWEWCILCNCAFIRCPKCGNNSCNGTTGAWDKDGKLTYKGAPNAATICDICPLVHEEESRAYSCKQVPAREGLKGGSAEDEEKFWTRVEKSAFVP